MKLRRKGIILLTLIGVLLAAGFWMWLSHYRAKRAVAEYKQQLIAAGEKLTIREWIPISVPAEQNGADLFAKAMPALNAGQGLLLTNPPPAMRMIALGKAMIGWKQPGILDFSSKATNSWAEVEAAVEELSEGLELLRQIVEKPRLDFAVNYLEGFNVRMPYLTHTKGAAQRLSAAAMCDLHRGDVGAAFANVRAMLALVKGSADERTIISQLVRLAIAAIAANVTWEIMQSPDATDEQLAALQHDWAELDFIRPLEMSFCMERAMGELAVTQMRESSAEFQRMAAAYTFNWTAAMGGAPAPPGNLIEQAEQFAKNSWDKTKLKARETAWRVAWSYPDQLRALKGHQVLIDTTRSVRSNVCFHAALAGQQNRLGELGILESDEAGDDNHDDSFDFRKLLSQGVVSLRRVIERLMRGETQRQMVITAIALKRHQIRHRSLPASLDVLAPEFLPAVPRDPVDGQPLRYRVNDDGTYLLYSVGEDGQDDGGNPKPANENSRSLQWQQGRDWVWPQPASEKEIESYHQSQKRD